MRIPAKEGAYRDHDVEKSGSTLDLQSSMIEGLNCCSDTCLYEYGFSVTIYCNWMMLASALVQAQVLTI